MKRSQMAMEFVMLVGIGFLMTMLIIIVIYDMNSDRNREKIDTKMKDFAYSLQSEIILASEMNDGYLRNISLNERIGGTEYNISLIASGDFMQFSVEYEDKTINYRIPLINGTITKGNNMLWKNNNTVYIIQ